MRLAERYRGYRLDHRQEVLSTVAHYSVALVLTCLMHTMDGFKTLFVGAARQQIAVKAAVAKAHLLFVGLTVKKRG